MLYQLLTVHHTILQELADHSGIDCLKPYPKIAGEDVHARTRRAGCARTRMQELE